MMPARTSSFFEQQKLIVRDFKRFLSKIKILYFHNFSLTPPVLIHTMGKVGSVTVTKSLYETIDCPIYHIHLLSNEGINHVEELYRLLPDPSFSNTLTLSKILRSKIDREGIENSRWRIITLTRDLLSIEVSDIFQNLDIKRSHLLDSKSNVKLDKVFEELHQRSHNFNELESFRCNWFDREIAGVFGVDIFAYPFSYTDGYTIISQDNVEILIIRLEDLDRCGSMAISKFLNLDRPIELITTNIATRKKFGNEYSFIKNNLSLSKVICEKYYSTKYMKHFYSESERKSFIENWSSKKTQVIVT